MKEKEQKSSNFSYYYNLSNESIVAPKFNQIFLQPCFRRSSSS